MSGFNLSAWAIRHQTLVLFFILVTAAAGVFAYGKLGRNEDPAFTVKVMVVTAVWPGASAAEMQDQVADRVETPVADAALAGAAGDLYPSRLHGVADRARGRDAALGGGGALVPGAQEGRRHLGRPAGGRHRSLSSTTNMPTSMSRCMR